MAGCHCKYWLKAYMGSLSISQYKYCSSNQFKNTQHEKNYENYENLVFCFSRVPRHWTWYPIKQIMKHDQKSLSQERKIMKFGNFVNQCFWSCHYLNFFPQSFLKTLLMSVGKERDVKVEVRYKCYSSVTCK